MPEEEVLTAIAWSMDKDPYRSAGGRYMRGRVVRIMLVDTFVITSFQALGRDPRITVTEYTRPHIAQHLAIRETQKREKEGFKMAQGPTSKETKPGIRAYLEGLRDFRGHDSNLAASIEHCLIKGTLLAA